MEVLTVITVVAAGLMVGSELAVAAFVHPTLDRLPDEVHLPVASALARALGRLMPAWYILVFLLIFAVSLLHWHQSGRVSVWGAGSASLWAFAIVYTVTTLVPINNRIASWATDTPPADWKSFRRRWDLLHRWRVVLLAVAFAVFVVGVVRELTPRTVSP